MYKNYKMFGKNFFPNTKLFIYSKCVFQVRNFYTHDTKKLGATMSKGQSRRKKDVQNLASSGKGELGFTKVNLKDRLSQIRKGQEKVLSITEFKNVSQFVSQEKFVALIESEVKTQNSTSKLLTNTGEFSEKELLYTEYSGKQSELSSVINGHRKLTIPERLAIRNKQLHIKMDNGLSEFSKNVANNLACNLTSDNGLLSKTLQFNIRIDVQNEGLQKEQHTQEQKSNTNLKLQNSEKFVGQREDIKDKNSTSENFTLPKNYIPVASILHGNKRVIQDRLQFNDFLKSSSDINPSGKVDTNPVTKATPETTSDISLTRLELDLHLVEIKMKNLTLKDQLEVIKLNQKRILSYEERLENLKKFVNKNDVFDKQTKYFPVLDRPILKRKRPSQQKRLLSTSSSYDAISDINKSDQKLKNIQVDGTEFSLSDTRSSNCKEDVNIDNNLSSKDLRRKLDKLRSESQENVVTTVSDTSKEPLECTHIKVEKHSEIQHFHEKFPYPKNTLHNYFQLLSEQVKDKSFKVEPYYKSVQNKHGTEWSCMYHLKWPENCKITAEGLTKKRASSFAALKCLVYLSERGKLSSDGLPLIHTKEEVKELTQKKQTELKFNDNIINKMQNIIDIFDKNMSDFIKRMDFNRYVDKENKVLEEEPESVDFLMKSPIYLGMHQYLAKEKLDLPISKFKELFINLVQNNNCIIVKGEPGCGKSSRVPQYILEAWVREATSDDQLCRIAVTQPRRIAAISLATRVASERDEELGHVVGYQVRLKSSFQPKTGRILYCTTGILLRHLQSDPNLTKFSHIVLDEAHERDINTDLLLNLLRKAMKENDNLKVVVMSATIDADTFSEYFEGAPIFNVPGFTYPVTKNFLDGCKLDVSKTLKMCNGENPRVVHEDVVEVLEYIHKNRPEGAILTFLPGWEDLVKVQKLIPATGDTVVHLVHSKLKDSEQYKIFSKPPPGVRKIILATNIAETSITVDDVVYVVDTGIHKDQNFDNDKGINVIDMEWISKAGANQRAGRAGRCSPGESYHLYTRDRFNQFPDYSSPKILNSSLTKVVLDSKMFTNNMNACDFMNSLITPPEKIAVERAVDELKQLDLLDENEKLTPLGRTVVNFQLEPNLAKAMVNAVVFRCTTPIVDIVTLFSSDTGLFGSLALTDKDSVKNVKSRFCKSSDHLALMRLYEKWLELCEEGGLYEVNRFCRDRNLVPYKLDFVNKLKDIHFGYLYNGLYESMPISETFSDNDELVKAVLYSGTGTVLKHRNWDIVKNRLKINTNVLVTRNNHKATISSESVNYKRQKFPSNFLVYINETRSNVRRTTIVRECSLIPNISVLLFSNKELEILEADPKNDEPSDNLVIIGIKNTKLQFLCDKTQAKVLMDCKKAVEASYKYLIHQLTYAGEEIPEFLEHWDNVLENLADILEKSRIE